MIEGVDFYYEENGYMVFTQKYHLDRGTCCKNRCRHCPWEYGKKMAEKEEKDKLKEEE